MTRTYDAVLFDNDGVLVELMDIEVIYGAVRETFDEFGVEPSERDVRALVGVSADELARICAKYCLDTDVFWERRDANVSRVQREAFDTGEKAPYDDIDAVERLARDHGRGVGVVSNNQHATVEHVIGSLDLPLDTYTGREPTVESLRRKKPAPFYIERALDELGTDDALYVGDSPSDVTAARRAGIDAAVVRRGISADGVDSEPDYIFDGLDEVEEVVG